MWDHVTIWEACRATAATTTFFHPFSIGPSSERFDDEGNQINNPVAELWEQATTQFGSPKSGQSYCLVSIGTGTSTVNVRTSETASVLASTANVNEHVASSWEERALINCQYFRFNARLGSEAFSNEEVKRLGPLEAATHDYLNSEKIHDQLRECANRLSQNRSRSPV